MSETVIIAPAAGTPVQTPPPAAPDHLADVHAVIAQLQGNAPAAPTPKGSEATPEAPATPTPASPAAPATSEPAKSEPQSKDTPAPVETAPATPAKVPYSKEEFAAFQGNYHRRDFDWDRWPEDLKESKDFARSIASGYGKRHATLEAQLREQLRQELGGQNQPPQSTTTPSPQANDAELTPEQMADAQELLVTPGKFFEGAKILFGTKQGRAVLAELGYADPAERAVVSQLVQSDVLTRAISNVAVDFPQYIDDAAYRQEVTAVIENTPLLHAKATSRNVDEATFAFAVANASVTAQRIATREQGIAAREATLKTREAAIAAKEQDLQKQIEATNRGEPKSPTLTPQVSGNNTGLKPSGVDEAREVMRGVGMAV